MRTSDDLGRSIQGPTELGAPPQPSLFPLTESDFGRASSQLASGTARLTRVVLQNYRSIEACDLFLGPLTFMVGPNGAGKSNFLDALRLVAEGLRTSLDHALRDRGGVADVRRRSGGHPTHFGMRLEFTFPDGTVGYFAFRVGARAGGAYVVQNEECVIGSERYKVVEGTVVIPPAAVSPPAIDDRLYLVNAAGLPPFRRVFDFLSGMGFYNLSPERMRALQPPDKGELLARDGSNLASVLGRLKKTGSGETKARIEEYLSRIAPGIESVEQVTVGHMETVEFRQSIKGAEHPWRFRAIHISDGTLRALGILVALFQARMDPGTSVVGIEEPEAALHPAAAGLLRDALREGARQVQVLVTSHSPDLLDDDRIDASEIFSVVNREGITQIAPLDQASRSALHDRLYTAGEMLRADQLAPDLARVPDAKQLRLFDLE
jgi:predicted ATPase